MASIQGKVKNKRFQTNGQKLFLGDDLQNPKLNEETARQILALIRNPITTVTHNLTQPSTSNIQQESVTKVPASLVTTKPTKPVTPPPPPPLRGLTPPIKRVLPAKSTKQMTEVLKEVMLELEPASPAMKNTGSICRDRTLTMMT